MLADELAHAHPGASNSLKEGLEETLTAVRFGAHGDLRQGLGSHEELHARRQTARQVARPRRVGEIAAARGQIL